MVRISDGTDDGRTSSAKPRQQRFFFLAFCGTRPVGEGKKSDDDPRCLNCLWLLVAGLLAWWK